MIITVLDDKNNNLKKKVNMVNINITHLYFSQNFKEVHILQ